MCGFSVRIRSIKDMTIEDFSLGMGVFSLFIALMMYNHYSTRLQNAEGVAAMKAAVPAIVSVQGTESLTEKMVFYSDKRVGLYSGHCKIVEKVSEKDARRYYKKEFEKNGWEYIGRRELSSASIGWKYRFEKDGKYRMDVSYTWWKDYKHNEITSAYFNIQLIDGGFVRNREDE